MKMLHKLLPQKSMDGTKIVENQILEYDNSIQCIMGIIDSNIYKL